MVEKSSLGYLVPRTFDSVHIIHLPAMTASASNSSSHASRFRHVSAAPPDAILGLTEAFNKDDRADKMNLSVGAYKDPSGITPVMKCVKSAEKKLIETETTKGYLPIDGMPDYRHHVRDMVFGETVPADRVAVVQTPGGTGAVRVAADFLTEQFSPLRVFLPSPTWANHNSIMTAAGLPTETYRYLSADKRSLDLDGMLDDLQTKAKPGDAVLLHACCHNPSGVDPNPSQWEKIALTLADANLLPLVDFAYQGFGEGLDEDATGLRAILTENDEAIVCTSFSKNFGLYGERVGAISLVAGDAASATASRSQLKKVVRSNYSNPPRHGAAIVATVLDDAELTAIWKDELAEMRNRIHDLRKLFVDGMQAAAPEHDFGFLLKQNGMFSFSGLNPMQVDQLRNEHGVYIVGSGRINVAGMSESRMDWLCQAVASVL